MFFSFHPKWKSKGTEVTEGVQIDLTQFLPKNYFSPSWIDSTFPCQVSMRWDLGGCLVDSNLVQVRNSGPREPQALARAIQLVGGGAAAGPVF